DASRSAWVVQIAATPVQETALEMLAEARQRAGSVLASAYAFTQAVDNGSQTLYRARFAGFETKAAANAACEVLKSRSYACYAIANN
ncbi:MAG: SPOR domain-containing protein, partial [Methylobacterium sp.]